VAIQSGSTIGGYQVHDLIGRGAMGSVYRGYHEPLDRIVAIKVLHSLAVDPTSAERFKREARAIAQLRHPNILSVFDFGEVDGVPFMVVEYMPGGSLAEAIRPGDRPSGADVVALLKGIAAGLDHAHGAGIVHRDVKPGNVLLSRDDSPVLADFGLAKMLEQASMSMSGFVAGTPSYMAPEQANGHLVGPEADRYALAIMAYELLTGRLPFVAEGVLEVIYLHVNAAPQAPSTVRPGLPEAVDSVLLTGLRKDPAQRWRSCTEMVDALAVALGLESPIATLKLRRPEPEGQHPTPAISQAVEPPANSWTAPPSAALEPRFRLLELVSVGFIVAVILVLSFLLYRPAPPTAEADPGAVRGGEGVVLRAHNLPARQTITVAIDNPSRRIGSARSDADGEMVTTATVPAATLPGPHAVLICWSGKCPTDVDIKVLP
jgi:serine/threonine-protein kinase